MSSSSTGAAVGLPRYQHAPLLRCPWRRHCNTPSPSPAHMPLLTPQRAAGGAALPGPCEAAAGDAGRHAQDADGAGRQGGGPGPGMMPCPGLGPGRLAAPCGAPTLQAGGCHVCPTHYGTASHAMLGWHSTQCPSAHLRPLAPPPLSCFPPPANRPAGWQPQPVPAHRQPNGRGGAAGAARRAGRQEGGGLQVSGQCARSVSASLCWSARVGAGRCWLLLVGAARGPPVFHGSRHIYLRSAPPPPPPTCRLPACLPFRLLLRPPARPPSRPAGSPARARRPAWRWRRTWRSSPRAAGPRWAAVGGSSACKGAGGVVRACSASHPGSRTRRHPLLPLHAYVPQESAPCMAPSPSRAACLLGAAARPAL